MADNGASIKIGSDTTQYEKGVKKVKDGFTDMNKSASSFSKIASGAISSFVGNLASTAVTKGFSVISNGFKSAISSVKEFTALSKIQEDALNDLDNSLVRTGQFSRATSKDIQAFASELQNNSRFGDEAILKNAALIQSLGSLSKDGLKQATQAAADLSAGIGKISFEQASEFIGKAALGNIGPLRELGIVVESTGDKAKDFQTALSLINDRFSGAAAGQIQNFTGVTQQLDNTIGDLKEKFGDLITQNPAIVTALQKVQQLFSELGSFVEDNKDELKALATEGFLLVVNGAFGLVGAVIEITSAFDRARTAYRAFLNAGSISRLEEELANLPAQIDAFGNRVETFYEGALKSQIERLKGETESERQSYEERLKLFESFTQKINEGQDAIKIKRDYPVKASPSIFPPLPESGWVEENVIYSYGNGAVMVTRGHNRTIYSPEETPALFSFYRENTDALTWIPNENVKRGWKRMYNGKQYEVVQPHMTLTGWEPDKTPALWNEVQQQGVKPPQWNTSNWIQYVVGYQVYDSGKVWEAINTTHTWIQPALTGNGAISWKYISDI
jgi:hypothetical protein